MKAPRGPNVGDRDDDDRLADGLADQAGAHVRPVSGDDRLEIVAVGEASGGFRPSPVRRPDEAVAVDPADPSRERGSAGQVDPAEVRPHPRQLLPDHGGRLGDRRERLDLAGERGVDERRDRDDACTEVVLGLRLRVVVLLPGEDDREAGEQEHGHAAAHDDPPAQGSRVALQDVDRAGFAGDVRSAPAQPAHSGLPPSPMPMSGTPGRRRGRERCSSLVQTG